MSARSRCPLVRPAASDPPRAFMLSVASYYGGPAAGRQLAIRPGGSDLGPGLGEDRAQDLLDLVEVLLGADQRRRELDYRVAAVVGAADQAGVEQRVRQEAAQQPLRLVVVERLLGVLVLDELDA